MLFVIPLPPATKKNSQRIIKVNGRPVIIPSAKYVIYEREAIKCLQAYFGGSLPPKIDYPCNVECKFYMPTRRRVDLNNLLEAATDVLVRAGILDDDNSQIVASHDGSRVFYDKENPRTAITIEHFRDPAKKEENQ